MLQRRTIYPHKHWRGQITRVSLLALFFCLALNPAYSFFDSTNSRGIKVTGTIKDSVTGAIIPNVIVSAYDKNNALISSQKTNSQGSYTLNIASTGRNTVVFIKTQVSGYLDQTKGGALPGPRTYTINFSLTPTKPPPKPDTIAPIGRISINNNQDFSNSPQLTLTLFAQDNPGGSGLSQMRFSNDKITWSNPETYATSKSWTLSSGDGRKAVYAKFSDKAGNWSVLYPAAIILDATPPKILITSPQNGSVLEDPQVQLQGRVDARTFSESRSLTSGENTLTKTATDTAGNSASASVKVYYYPGTLIGPEGGEVSSADGKVKINIPKDALSVPRQISILNIDKGHLSNLAPEGKSLLSVVECKPAGLNFSLPVTITYTFNEAQVPGTAVSLGLYEDGKIYLTSDPSVIPALDSYKVTFHIQHFSTYAALSSFITQGAPIGSGVKIPLPDLLTGSFSSSIPITVPPGRKGMQPQLALNYRSSNSNSWTGLGFSLNPGYIVRSTRLGPPTYDDKKDTFYLITDAGTTELVNLVDNLYQAKVESSFTKFFKETDDSWRALSKDGATLRFGQTSESKENSNSGTFSWYITKATDTNGNYISYSYTKDQGKAYLGRIDYTGNENGTSPANSVEFEREARTDVSLSYISTARIVTGLRLKEIRVKAGDELVWSYALEYSYSPDTGRSILKSITQYASDEKSLPTQTFSYQEAK